MYKVMKKNNFTIKSINNYNISATYYEPDSYPSEIIIACHGFGGDKESSAIIELANKVSTHNIGLICFDFPGHGQSDVNADQLSINNCINDITSIENYIKLNFKNIPISIFATSFGAYITLLKIFKYQTEYRHIILRAPAIKMDEIFKNSLIKENMSNFKERGFTELGFERKMNVPYSFYEDLLKNNIFDLYNNSQKILIIQGTADDIAPISDTYEFIKLDTNNLSLVPIEGADHRMKKEGELEKAINYSVKYILK